MEFASFVAFRARSCTKNFEILSCFWDNFIKKLKNNSTCILTINTNIKKSFITKVTINLFFNRFSMNFVTLLLLIILSQSYSHFAKLLFFLLFWLFFLIIASRCPWQSPSLLQNFQSILIIFHLLNFPFLLWQFLNQLL